MSLNLVSYLRSLLISITSLFRLFVTCNDVNKTFWGFSQAKTKTTSIKTKAKTMTQTAGTESLPLVIAQPWFEISLPYLAIRQQ